jgi:hypothetical protein
MKKPNWKRNFPLHYNILTHKPRLKIGDTGRATYKDITVHLEITAIVNDTLFHAVVNGFEPPTATLPDLQVTDKVEVGIQHFLPD